MAEYKGMMYLRNLLSMKRLRIQKRYKYYEMKNGVDYFRTLIPKEFMYMSEVLGWCGKAVDCLGDRRRCRGGFVAKL